MTLDAVFRKHWGRVLATLVGVFRDVELAEDAAQEAFAIAAERWPRDGEPDNPVAWLISTARNRAIDHIRRQRVVADKTKLLAHDLEVGSEATMHDSRTFPDERLELIFTCCHPALAPDAQVALTLRALGGLTTEQIALAFLVPTETMSKRLVRAKHKIRDAGIPLAVPPDHQHYRYFHSARADLLRRAGHDRDARLAYQRALELAQTDGERQSLREQLAQLPRTD